MMCSSLVIWIQSVHFVKKRNKKALGSHVPRALSVWGKSQCQYVSDGVFGGSFLWLGTVDGCGLWKDLVTSPCCCSWLGRQVSPPSLWKRKCRSSPCPVSYIIPFILSDSHKTTRRRCYPLKISEEKSPSDGELTLFVSFVIIFSLNKTCKPKFKRIIWKINRQSRHVQGWFHLRGPLSVYNHACNCERNLTD